MFESIRLFFKNIKCKCRCQNASCCVVVVDEHKEIQYNESLECVHDMNKIKRNKNSSI